MGFDGQCCAQCIRGTAGMSGRQTIALCGDGGFTMSALGHLLTKVQRKTPVVQIIFNNETLDFVNFVNIEQQLKARAVAPPAGTPLWG